MFLLLLIRSPCYLAQSQPRGEHSWFRLVASVFFCFADPTHVFPVTYSPRSASLLKKVWSSCTSILKNALLAGVGEGGNDIRSHTTQLPMFSSPSPLSPSLSQTTTTKNRRAALSLKHHETKQAIIMIIHVLHITTSTSHPHPPCAVAKFLSTVKQALIGQDSKQGQTLSNHQPTILPCQRAKRRGSTKLTKTSCHSLHLVAGY